MRELLENPLRRGAILISRATGIGAMAFAVALALPSHAQDDAEIELVGPEIAQSSDTPFRSDTVTIRVGGLIENYGALEYKISMKKGDVVVYSWAASDPIHYEFHGHSAIVPGQPVTDVHWYRIDDGSQSNGSLVAPVGGIHGWYFVNPSFDAPIEIELKLSGYYSLEPGILTGRTNTVAVPEPPPSE